MKFLEGKVELIINLVEEQQDQLILSWILATVSPSILSQVASLATSMQVWDSLHQLFGMASEICLLYLMHQLHTMCKGTLSMTEYLKKVSVTKDMTAAAGEKMEMQVILITLNVFGSDYKVLVTSKTT